MKLVIFLIIAGIGVLVMSSSGMTACTGASPTWLTTPDQSSVQTCVNSAATGDTVLVSDGSATWTSRVNFPSVAFTFKTATTPTMDSEGRPTNCPVTITDNTDYTGAGTWSLIVWPTASSGLHRISGFCFDGNATGAADPSNRGMLAFNGATDSFRFDHNRVTTERTAAGFIRGYLRGVFDHNVLTLHQFKFGFYTFHDSWNNNANGCGAVANGCGDASWAAPSTVGTASSLYFEDNLFVDEGTGFTYGSDGWGGARAVYRFNQLNNVVLSFHGTESSGRTRGVRQLEYYRNSIHFTAVISDPMSTRGGTGLAFHNFSTTSGGGFLTRPFAFSNYRSGCPNGASDCNSLWWRCDLVTLGAGNLTSSGTTATVQYNGAAPVAGQNSSFVKVVGANEANYNGTFLITGVSGTTFTYTMPGTASSPATGTITVSSPWDQNSESNGYRCLDQPGAGQGDLIGSGADPTPRVWPNQILDPWYVFSNYLNGAKQTTGGAFPAVVVLNRDLYEHVASFNGTVGVGEGLRASRPAGCTTGVAYWSTDGGSNWNTSTTETHSSTPGEDGGLDKCTATNTWTNDAYVPYTYPHPLQGIVIAVKTGRIGGRAGGGTRVQ